MKLGEKSLFIVLCYIHTVLFGIPSVKGTSHITLSSKSGTHSVCKDEARVYICRVHAEVVVWKCGRNMTVISSANDSVLSHVLLDGRIVVTSLSTNTTDFKSQLVLQYMNNWNNTKIQCSSNGQSEQETLTYIIADQPVSPTITAKNQTQNTVTLQWDVNHVDCHMVMIVENGANLMNVSYYTESAIVDISNYALQEWILIEVYGVNHCGRKSEDPTTLKIEIGNHSVNKTVSYSSKPLVNGLIGCVVGFIVALLVCVVSYLLYVRVKRRT